jgi:hypothetical protein
MRLPGPNFLDEKCAVPDFDFSDVRLGTQPPTLESAAEKFARVRSDLEAKGYRFLKEESGKHLFRGKDGSVAAFDITSGELSLDLTGKALLRD